jgi:hypothetical protein
MVQCGLPHGPKSLMTDVRRRVERPIFGKLEKPKKNTTHFPEACKLLKRRNLRVNVRLLSQAGDKLFSINILRGLLARG